MSMQKLNSNIQSVTVFPRQALVGRQAKVQLEPGLQKLFFAALPPAMDGDSVQVEGDKRLLLHDVKTEMKQLEASQHPHLEKLKGFEQDLTQKQKAMLTRQKRLHQEKEFVEGLGKRITTATEQSHDAEWSPENWRKLLDFYASQLERLDQEILKLDKELHGITEELDKIRRQIQALGTKPKWEWQVEVQVEVPIAGEYDLSLSYLIGNASWEPVYDLRVDSDQQQVELFYKANVRQNTGEDWPDVQLVLSTARPSRGANPPEARPQFVAPYAPPPALRSRAQAISVEGLADAMPAMEPEVVAMSAPAPQMKKRQVKVEEQAISASFQLESRYSLLSDNQSQQFSLAQFELKAQFEYLVIPYLQTLAYLQAEMTNDSSFTLLPGEGRVFLDGQFVAKNRLNTIAPGETFEQTLGIDEGIKIEHELRQKHRVSKGLMSKRDKQRFIYRMQLSNLKKRAVQIQLQDRYPLSQDEQIKVELIQPAYKADTEALQQTDQHILTWKFAMQAAEEKEIWLEYTVSYPEGMRVVGV
jgi:uncharacterized protein (TIGR02231 family)